HTGEHHKTGESSGESGEAVTSETTLDAADATVLGINLENPWLVGATSLIWVLLAGAILRFGYRVLPLIMVGAVVMVVFDIIEIITQINKANTTIAIFATAVAITHIGVGILSLLALRQSRRIAPLTA